MDIFGLFPGCKTNRIERGEAALVVHIDALAKKAACPTCGIDSTHIHSYYTRSLRDTFLGTKSTNLRFRQPRFYCREPSCGRVTFSEAVSLFKPYARRTARLIALQTTIGIYLSGEAGSRLLGKLSMPLCSASLLQSVRAQATEHCEVPRVLGVDDWAIKKGRTYRILVDLEKHKVVDLLSDRSAAAPWAMAQRKSRR